MSSRGKRAVDPSKLELIKQGKKKVNVTDFKENKNTISNKNGQFIAIQKERKFEEAGVTRKKRNFVMYESKQGTEKDVDYLKLAGAKKKAPPKKVQETIISKHKKKQYLDNFQYHETKNLKNKKPSVVVHNRMSNPITGAVEEYSYQKTTLRTGSAGSRPPRTGSAGSRPAQKTTSTTTRTTRTSQTTSSLRSRSRPESRTQPKPQSRPQSRTQGRPQRSTSATATKSKESTTRVGRRGGAGGRTSTTTTTKTSTRTTTTRGRK